MSDMKQAYDLGAEILLGFANLPKNIIAHYERYSDQIPGAFARGFVIPVEPALAFSVIATIKLGPVAGKKTSRCLVGRRWMQRSHNFNNWLDVNQPASKACAVTVLSMVKKWTFLEVAARVLNVNVNTLTTALLSRLLIEHGYTLTLPQVEVMVEKIETGKKKAGWRTDACLGSFFFIETNDPENPVAVGHVHRDDSHNKWYAILDRPDYCSSWVLDNRFLLRNLNVSKLGI